MRTLVISDIHGNIDALEAIEDRYDSVIFLGDIVDYGPEPVACIDYLKKLDVPLVRVRGNHDNAVAFRIDCGCGQAYLHLSTITREYMWEILEQGHLDWIGQPETSIMLDLDGHSVCAVHGAPSDHLFRYLFPETGEAELAAELELSGADIVLTGHTHKPFMRKLGDRLMVNVGSVGQPRDGIPEASYAILENGRVELKRVKYDIASAVSKLKKLPIDKAAIEELAFVLMNADMPPRDNKPRQANISRRGK